MKNLQPFIEEAANDLKEFANSITPDMLKASFFFLLASILIFYLLYIAGKNFMIYLSYLSKFKKY